jgi:manganese transport protein
MKGLLAFLRSIGPAIIVAAVVCGPGSMLMSSKTGAIYGYRMIWLVLVAATLMWSMIALSARLGIVLERTPLGEIAARLGRPVAAAVGIILFLIVVGFQVSNNIAIIAALEPFLSTSPDDTASGAAHGTVHGAVFSIGALVVLNLLMMAVLFQFGDLYKPIERLLKGIVLVVIVAFTINLFLARPSPGAMLAGMIPSAPDGGFAAMLQPRADPNVTVLQALVATTFSVAGAFFQAYSVRARGWTLADASKGMADSLVGVCVLAGVSIILMSTAAAAFHGRNADSLQLATIGDVSRQLQPLFGRYATLVFSAGVFAGGFGAFLVNALIGGNMLADGFGWGETINDRGTKLATAAALLIAMLIASVCILADVKPVAAITVAQASTVMGLPALAAALLYLGTRPELTGDRRIARWMLGAAFLGLLVTLFLTARTLIQLQAVLGQ